MPFRFVHAENASSGTLGGWRALMRVLVATLGSYGDVYPFIALATVLKSRGHEIVLLTNGFFPRGNAILIAAGVGCFFLSDVCVGYYRSLPRNYTMAFATYLTWIFYAPALVLTALSSYELDRIF